MAAYDYGGGCACGLYSECRSDCEHNEANKLSTSAASHALMSLVFLRRKERAEVLARFESIVKERSRRRMDV